MFSRTIFITKPGRVFKDINEIFIELDKVIDMNIWEENKIGMPEEAKPQLLFYDKQSNIYINTTYWHTLEDLNTFYNRPIVEQNLLALKEAGFICNVEIKEIES